MPAVAKPKVVKDPEWLKVVRQMPCRVEGPTCHYGFGWGGARVREPNHLRKRNDDSCVTPLCPGHHRTNTVSWHNGEKTFCRHYGLTKTALIREAEAAYRLWKEGQ